MKKKTLVIWYALLVAAFIISLPGQSDFSFCQASAQVNRGRIYVANSISETVSVIDVNSNVVTATIQLPRSNIGGEARPTCIASNPTGTRVYVGLLPADAIAVIDTSTNTVITTISLPPLNASFPNALTINPSGTRLYVVCNSGITEPFAGKVVVINTADNSWVTTISVGYQPTAIAINPAGSRLYVGHAADDRDGQGGFCTFSVIDTVTNTVIDKKSINDAQFFSPGGMIVSRDNTKLYVIGGNGNNTGNIQVITTNNNTWADALVAGTNPMGVMFDQTGRYLYVSGSSSHSLSIVDLNNKSVEAVQVGARPQSVALNSAGTRAYVSNMEGNSVSVVDLTKNTVVKTIGVGLTPVALVATP